MTGKPPEVFYFSIDFLSLSGDLRISLVCDKLVEIWYPIPDCPVLQKGQYFLWFYFTNNSYKLVDTGALSATVSWFTRHCHSLKPTCSWIEVRQGTCLLIHLLVLFLSKRVSGAVHRPAIHLSGGSDASRFRLCNPKFATFARLNWSNRTFLRQKEEIFSEHHY